MGKYAQIVMGPAGTGKTTYCKAIYEHCTVLKRVVHLFNLDPAIEDEDDDEEEDQEEEVESSIYSFDVRELISVEEAMKQMKYGPNGALIFCMEYLVKNLDWLREKLADHDDDYLIFDCPGQIELFTHYKIFNKLIKELENMGYKVCVVYLLDSVFVTDISKFIAGSLTCLSAMIQFEVPHLNVITKCDLLKDEDALENFLESDAEDLSNMLEGKFPNKKFQNLNKALCQIMTEFSMVSFVPLNIKKPESLDFVLSKVDHSIQYGEDLEPKMKDIQT